MQLKCLIIYHDSKFKKELLNLFSPYNPELIHHSKFHAEHAEDFDFVVLSGGPIRVHHPEDLVVEKEFLRNTDKPVFGICLGHQIIGVTFGSELHTFGFHLRLPRSIEAFNRTGEIFNYHSDYITRVPEGFSLISRSGNIVEAMVHESKPFFSTQGHPECSGEFGVQLRDQFIKNYVKPRILVSTEKTAS